jgi:hypothetical protein
MGFRICEISIASLHIAKVTYLRVPEADVLHGRVTTLITFPVVFKLILTRSPNVWAPTHLPVETLAVALLAKVVAEWIGAQEPDQRVQFSHSVLKWCSGKTPLVLRIQRESSFRSIGRSLFDVVRFVENDSESCQQQSLFSKQDSPMPLERVHW